MPAIVGAKNDQKESIRGEKERRVFSRLFRAARKGKKVGQLPSSWENTAYPRIAVLAANKGGKEGGKWRKKRTQFFGTRFLWEEGGLEASILIRKVAPLSQRTRRQTRV